MTKLTFDNVSFGYSRNLPIFRNTFINLKLENPNRGKIIALMGSSGSGKSTLLKLILGMQKPLDGEIKIYPNKAVVSYQPQDAVLFEFLSPKYNARYFERSTEFKSLFDNNLFNDLAIKLGMDSVLNNAKSIVELSGGQRQRLSLLRALSIRPDIILLDEATNGLDSEVKIQFLQELRRLTIEQGILAIYTTHHKIEAELCADEVLYIHKAKNGFNEFYHNNIEEFVEKPPILDAARVFNYPMSNIVHGNIENHQLNLVESSLSSYFFDVKIDSIETSAELGFEFDLVSRAPKFSTIRLRNGNQLVLPTATLIHKEHSMILLTGSVNIYSLDEKYIQTLSIVKNRVI